MVTEFFLTFPVFLCGKMEKIIFPTKGEQFFSNIEKYFFQSFQVQHFKRTMKFQIRTIYWD